MSRNGTLNAANEDERCREAMQDVRKRCLGLGSKHWPRRVKPISELIREGMEPSMCRLPYALRVARSRYPSWDPEGLETDPRSTGVVGSYDTLR